MAKGLCDCGHPYVDHVDDGRPGECIYEGCECAEYFERDPTPYCSYGHRSVKDCDCGPIAENE